MLKYILLAGCIATSVGQVVMQKEFNIRTKNKSVYFFGALVTFLAALVFLGYTLIIKKGALQYELGVLPYSVALAAAFGAATVATVAALQNGPIALTSLLGSYSLLIPTFYGILFLHSTPSVCFWIGIGLLLIAMFLIYFRKEDVHVKPIWFFYVALAFVSNGINSTIQTIFVTKYGKEMSNEFMMVGLFLISVTMTVLTVCRERKEISFILRRGAPYAVSYGLLNGVLNLLVILIIALDSSFVSVMYPCISAFGMIFTLIVSRVLYKERLTKMQLIGFFVGTASCVLLNI